MMFNVTDMVVRAFAYCQLLVSLILRRLKSYRPIELFFAILLLAAILGFALHALVLLYDGRYSVTRQDYWRIYRLDLRLPFPLNVFYKHNDHPVVFPSFVWLSILHFFQNDQTLLFLCGTGVTLATLFLLLFSLWRSGEFGLVPRLCLALIFTVACLWVGKANILASGGFSCMNSMTTTAVIAGLLGLDSLRTSFSASRPALFVGIAVAGVVATFSFATGVASWPALILVALFYKLDRKIAAGLGVIGGLSVGIFFLLPNDAASEIGSGISHLRSELPILAVRFVEVLGAPWVFYARGGEFPARDESAIYLVAAVIGALGLFLAAYFTVKLWRPARISATVETIALGMMLFILGSIGLIVLGRGELLAQHPDDVFAPRYCFWSPFFWAMLPVLGLCCWPRLCTFPALITTLALALTTAAVPSQVQFGKSYRKARIITETAALKLICGVEDQAALQSLFTNKTYSAAAVYPLTRLYRERGLDMFAWPGASLVGKRVSPVDPDKIVGPEVMGHWQVDRVFSTIKRESAAEFSGWCLTRKTHLPADFVVIYQPNGTIVGLSKRTVPDQAKNQRLKVSSRSVLAFRGYIRGYTSKRRYECRPAIKGDLISQNLIRIGLDMPGQSALNLQRPSQETIK